MTTRLAGKVIVVTGAAGGIGGATVRRLLDESAQVLATDLSREALEQAFPDPPSTLELCAADVTVEADVGMFLSQAKQRFGQVNGLLNNAGIEGDVCLIEDYPTDMYERVMSINAKSVFLGIKHGIKHLRAAGGGSIVNTASVAGIRGSAMLSAYNASKHAVIGLTRSTAHAYARIGIRTNAVCPAPIETSMMRSIELGLGGNEPETVRDSFAQSIPLGRYGEPEEVAALIAFLLSDEAQFVNGSIYTIDGGLTPQ
jgi:NAD(P)-dependent dehydrogenase (short-subunit alcohol dehydrogenase family)